MHPYLAIESTDYYDKVSIYTLYGHDVVHECVKAWLHSFHQNNKPTTVGAAHHQ